MTRLRSLLPEMSGIFEITLSLLLRDEDNSQEKQGSYLQAPFNFDAGIILAQAHNFKDGH